MPQHETVLKPNIPNFNQGFWPVHSEILNFQGLSLVCLSAYQQPLPTLPHFCASKPFPRYWNLIYNSQNNIHDSQILNLQWSLNSSNLRPISAAIIFASWISHKHINWLVNTCILCLVVPQLLPHFQKCKLPQLESTPDNITT